MSNSKIIIALCTASLSLVSTAAADSGTQPAVSKEVSALHGMVGNWRGNVALKMGGQTAKLSLAIDCELTSSGSGVACKSRFSGPGMVVEETDLFGYDPDTGKYHWFAVSSAGETHDHVADPPKGNQFHWVYRGTKDGKPFVESIRMGMTKGGTMTFANRATLGGKTLFTLDGSARKR